MSSERKKGTRPVEPWQMVGRPVDDLERLAGFELGTGHTVVFKASALNGESKPAKRSNNRTGKNKQKHRRRR